MQLSNPLMEESLIKILRDKVFRQPLREKGLQKKSLGLGIMSRENVLTKIETMRRKMHGAYLCRKDMPVL